MTSDIEPREGYAHVGCPTCGEIAAVALDISESLPWCIHHNRTLSWVAPTLANRSGPFPWTQMVRVMVREAP